MPQARLPDINTSIIKFRNEVLGAIKNRDWTLMHGCLDAYNGELPEEYQVKISTIEYRKIAKVDITYCCNVCAKETDKDLVEVFELTPNAVQVLLTSKTASHKTWQCPSCNQNNRLLETVVNETKLEEPSFLGVVEKPPNKKLGLMDHNTFEQKTKSWGLGYLSEIEHKAAQFRDDNWHRGDEETDLGIDGGEEED